MNFDNEGNMINRNVGDYLPIGAV